MGDIQIAILGTWTVVSLMGGLIIPHSRNDYKGKTTLGKIIVGMWDITCIIGISIMVSAHYISIFWNRYCIKK